MIKGVECTAAFGRLRVETESPSCLPFSYTQPPSGGCVLKRYSSNGRCSSSSQPPSGGCVLKQAVVEAMAVVVTPAAFGRLRVETYPSTVIIRR